MDWGPDAIPDNASGKLQEEFRPTPGTAAAGIISMALICQGMAYWFTPSIDSQRTLILPRFLGKMTFNGGRGSLSPCVSRP
jgi:hypothetical protein